MTLEPGWLQRQMTETAVEVATWPESMRNAAGFTDEGLTDDEIVEAVNRLKRRVAELERYKGRCRKCVRLGYKCPSCYGDSCLCGGRGCNSCEPRGVY